jgi:hypothetical protein
MLKKMEQVRQKANSIADGADMNNRSKAKVRLKCYWRDGQEGGLSV